MTKRLVLGVGINDAGYVVNRTEGGNKWRCPYYKTWLAMLERCYSKPNKRRDYVGNCVCREWLTFSAFKAWMEKQDWKGKQLDKDVLVVGNKHYSPETCLFVDSTVNGLLKTAKAIRGDLPIGVSRHKKGGAFEAKISINNKQVRLGFFKCPKQAHKAWVKAKVARIIEVAREQEDKRIVSGLVRHARQIARSVNEG